MKSRQVYGYAVAFHVTGERKYLDLAKEGVAFIMKNGFQRLEDGRLAPITFWTKTDKGWTAGPLVAQRTSQDMAYSLTGLAFYYYLTNDKDVLKVIDAVKDYIFSTYYDEGQHIFRWVLENFRDDTTDRWELVAQLDQIYGYMIWLSPSLPIEQRAKWQEEMVKIAHILKDTFYAGDCSNGDPPMTGCGLFWGDATPGHFHVVGRDHTDYGHSVKAMWMIYVVGKMAGDKELAEFGRLGAIRIINRAYNPADGSWNRDPLHTDKEWWSFCELDQVTETLALSEPEFTRYLPYTWKYWKTHFVDQNNHEVWHGLKTDGTVDSSLPKQHSWKNMMHSTEHALVGYIVSNQLHGASVTLHFAWAENPSKSLIHPYLFQGDVKAVEPEADGATKVTFANIR